MNDLLSEVTSTTAIEKIEGKRLKRARMDELDNLVEHIERAGHLNDEKKTLYKKLAEYFTEEFRENLFNDQFTMADKYTDTTFDEWSTFLNDRLVKTYVDRHKRTMLKNNAEANLNDPYSKGKRDTLNLLKSLEEKDKNYSNQNIVIMRIPPRDE